MDEYPFPENFGDMTKHTAEYYDKDRNRTFDQWENKTGNKYEFTINSNDLIEIKKTPVDDGMRPWGHSDLEFMIANKMTEPTNHLWKYNEDKILKDIQEYVTSTYGSHYCGHNQNYNDIQTIDLMAAKDLAAHFCQANILKYGSRYGDKDGRNKRDLLKVIHYAMLLLHFDGHYSRKDNGLTEFR